MHAPPLQLGVTFGDVTGIGPEIAAHAIAQELAADTTHYALLGDRPRFESLIESAPFRDLRPALETALQNGRIRWLESSQAVPTSEPPGSPLAARAALDWLRTGTRLCLNGTLDALITAPLNKHAVAQTGQPFVGQTEFLSELSRTRETAMMLLGTGPDGNWLRVSLATTHLALRDVAAALSLEKLRKAIQLTAQACHNLNLPSQRVAVCGLNPHAGEAGQFGDEEARIILPAIEAERQQGLDISGPLAADTVFRAAYQGRYDAVVAMYHDQGLGPLKLVAFDTGVNWTLGLPFIRTSPDHGTAYDIAGRGIANPSSMRAAIQLARQLARRRREPTGNT